MKNTLLLSLLTLTFFTACKKSTTAVFKTGGTTAYIFGTYGGFCSQPCERYYLVKNGHVFKDSSKAGPAFFVTPLADSNYTILKPLIDSLPTYLTDRPNTNYTCSGCADQPIYYIAVINGNDTTKWNIDGMSTTPAAVYRYVLQVQDALQQAQH